MELKNYAIYIVVNSIFFNIYCWASNLVAFERLSYNELASECLGEEYVHIMNTIIALAIDDCHNNSTLRYEITDQAANADEESTDLDGVTVLTIIKKNGKDRDERRMMNGGGEGGGEEDGTPGGEPDYGYGGGEEEEETGGGSDYGYGGDEGEDGGETDYDYGGGEGEGGGETDYGYGGGETDYGDGGEEGETGYEDYNGGGSDNGDDGSTYESYGKQNRKSFVNNSKKNKNNSNKKGFRSSNNNKNSRKGFRNNKNSYDNQKSYRNQKKGRSNINRNNKGFDDYDNFGSFNNNNNQEFDYRKNRYNGRTPNTESRTHHSQKYSGNNRGRSTNRGRGNDFEVQGRSNIGQDTQPSGDNQGYTNNDRIDDHSNDYDYQSRGERKDERDFDDDIGAAFGFEIQDGYSRKKRKSSYRPDLTSISDLIIREIGIEDKFLTFECVLQRRLEITEESDIRNLLATKFKLSEKAIKDFEESWNKCLDYVECVMEMFPHSTVFPRRMRRILELGKCIQRQIRLNCIKNDIRNVLPSTSQTNGTLTEIFDELVTKLLEIVAFNGDMESFDLLLI